MAAGYIPPDAVVSGAERYRIPDNARLPVSRSREALADFTAGLAQAGLPSCPGLTMLCADDEQSIELARYILQSWQKNLSVYFELVPLSPDELASRVGVGNYELALYTLTPSSLTAQGVLGGSRAQPPREIWRGIRAPVFLKRSAVWLPAPPPAGRSMSSRGSCSRNVPSSP